LYRKKEYAEQQKFRISVGNLEISFSPAVHAYPSHVITVVSGNKKLVYSGDTEYFPQLAELAAGADLFLCEANYLQKDIKNGSPNHLAAYQAGKTARDAGVKRLVLTHHHPERNLKKSWAEAAEYFANLELASAGAVYFV
jgi:ribonuclease BN (tRNA processing enzyme)